MKVIFTIILLFSFQFANAYTDIIKSTFDINNYNDSVNVGVGEKASYYIVCNLGTAYLYKIPGLTQRSLQSGHFSINMGRKATLATMTRGLYTCDSIISDLVEGATIKVNSNDTFSIE